jgi:hypothetical protein
VLRLSGGAGYRLLPIVAVITILHLGVLTPLSCIVHCALQQRAVDQSALAFFLCSEHHTNADAAIPVAAPADGASPRAFYELLCPLMLLAVLPLLPLAWQSSSSLIVALSRREPPPLPPPRSAYSNAA